MSLVQLILGVQLSSTLTLSHTQTLGKNKIPEMETPKEVTETDDTGNKLYTVHFRGHVFGQGFPKDPETRLDSMKTFKCRPDDIVITSFPKSGLHWTNNIVKMMTTDNVSYKGSPTFLEYEDLTVLDKMDSPRIYCFHHMFDLLPKDVQENKCRLIHVTRNPKDALVSFYEFFLKIKFGYIGDFKGFFNFYISNKFCQDSWFTTERNWYQAVKERQNLNVLQLRYEDMKLNLYETLKRINDFLELGRSDDFLRDIERNVDFERLKKEHSEQGLSVGSDLSEFVKDEGSSGILPIYRKGVVGDWKKYFTVAQNELFDEVYAQKMSGCEFNFKYE